MSASSLQIPQFTPPSEILVPAELSPRQRSSLEIILKEKGAKYDPEWCMLRQALGKPLYHTQLRGDISVHSTRGAFEYAVELLDSGGEAELQRAEYVLRATLALQETDPESNAFGIWSWFAEEPVSQMAPPDWNWADFCGVRLLQVTLSHRHRLSPDLAVSVDEAIARACFSIKRRSMGYDYTNIALMGIYVTLVAGETYSCPELVEWAIGRLRGFTTFTRASGGFLEFNSPNYTMVALDEIGRMRAHVHSEEARPLIEELYHLTWSELAHHFHATTRQWAGPHSRSYQTLVKNEILLVIQDGTDGELDFGVEGDLDFFLGYRLPLPCPPDLIPYFKGEHQPRTEQFVRRYRPAGVDNGRVPTTAPEPSPIEATTFLHPEVTFGSVKRGNFWDQSRHQIAYFGTAENPCWFRPRLIRDGIDFAAGQLFTSQREGLAVAIATFATDGGTNHIHLDKLQNSTFQASDLRLRFEFGGLKAERVPFPTDFSGLISLERDGLWIQLRVLGAILGDIVPLWSRGEDERGGLLDLVFYSGPERNFDLGAMAQAWAVWAVRISTSKPEPLEPEARKDRGFITVECQGLAVTAPVKPMKLEELPDKVIFSPS